MTFADIARSALVSIAALMPIVNPIGSAPLFLSLSSDLTPEGRAHLARRVGINAFVLLVGAMLVGSHILDLFGISIPVVRVGGGLLVMANGWRLINAEAPPPDTARDTVTSRNSHALADRAFYPLTFPLTVGPGSISVAITLGARLSGQGALPDFISELLAVAIVALSVFLSFRFAAQLMASLGSAGQGVFLRLSAFILLCVGVAILWSGLGELIRELRN